jgi:Ricin-type beta-trefoil lectin domain
MSAAVASPAGAAAAHPAAAGAAPRAGVRTSPALSAAGLKLVTVPDSPLHMALKARLSPASATLDSAEIIEIHTYAPDAAGGISDMCVDANDVGSNAGQNGDIVQLWKCEGTTNQEWALYKEHSGSQDGDFSLYNVMYPNECLNANSDGGLSSGSLVQLWGCNSATNASNFFWDLGAWTYCLSEIDACVLYLESDNWRWNLNAATPPGEVNEDPLQLWTPVTTDNDDWTCAGNSTVCSSLFGTLDPGIPNPTDPDAPSS